MSELAALMEFLNRQPPVADKTLAERRALYDRAEKAFALPSGVQWRPVGIDGMPAELLTPESRVQGRRTLYLHGGGYGIGSPRSHRHLAAAIAVAAKSDVLVPDYRLAPEHRFPAALDDALASYAWLAELDGGGPLAIMGDSAGGGLVVSTMVAARDRGWPLPAAAVCLSPWVDLTCGPDSPVATTLDDPLVRFAEIEEYIRGYVGEASARNPLVSPVFADLAGLPPLLIHAGTTEALRSDAERLAAAARAAGVETTLELGEGVPHVWHWFWPRLGLARQSIDRIGAFVDALM